MSVEFYVYLHDRCLPSREDWQRAIIDDGGRLELAEFLPRDHSGFLPTRLDGQECGFEYSFQPIEPIEIDELVVAIEDRDCVVGFRWHSSELDLRSAEIAAVALAKLANGVFYDPQSGKFAKGRDAVTLVAAQRKAERERKLAQAEKKWAQTTQRRCPECHGRCPEYRETCWVCGYRLGRV